MRSKQDEDNQDSNVGSDDGASGLSAGYMQAQQLLNAEHPGTQGGPTPNQPRPPEGASKFCQKCGSPVVENASLCSECGAETSDARP